MANLRTMTAGDAAGVAALHAAALADGFLVALGARFLRQLYLGIAAAPGAGVWVADGGAGGRLAGFCAYARDVGALYRTVLRARFFRLGWAALPAAFAPRVLREVGDALRYPGKQAACALPTAEILSLAVAPAARGQGLARQLVAAAAAQARSDGETALKVLAGAELAGANALYLKCGFERVGELQQHGHALNVYVLRL